MKKIVKAGIILIGDELLSGRTQDTNLATLAKFLSPLGVGVGEARIIADDAETISRTVKLAALVRPMMILRRIVLRRLSDWGFLNVRTR